MISKSSFLRNAWLQLFLSQFCTLFADLCLKRGAMTTIHLSPRWAWTGVTGLTSPLVWLGILFLILSFVTWLYVLQQLPLSVAFPVSQVVHVMIPLGSWLVLGEIINAHRWAGIAFVMLGLFLVAKPVAKLEERL
ncbi:MAG: EamA family transporter [Verrucomicrobiota bacterium]|nr:EamA family transporter [Verrucomicrobiota bacterium]